MEIPIFTGRDASRLDRHAAGRIVGRVARPEGITKPVGPHTLRHAVITAALDAASRCPTCRRPHPTPIRAPPCATIAPASPWTGTPLTSSPPTSRAPPGNRNRLATARPGGQLPGGAALGHRSDHLTVTDRDPAANAKRRSGRAPVHCLSCHQTGHYGLICATAGTGGGPRRRRGDDGPAD